MLQRADSRLSCADTNPAHRMGKRIPMNVSRGKALVLAALGLMVWLAASPVPAQIPDSFTNLKVFPSDVPKRQLIDTMKGFTQALGVRCQFCHVGEGDDLATFNFASDDKEHKQIAREMIRMVKQINEGFIGKLPAESEPRQTVTCMTCHRGQATPEIKQAP